MIKNLSSYVAYLQRVSEGKIIRRNLSNTRLKFGILDRLSKTKAIARRRRMTKRIQDRLFALIQDAENDSGARSNDGQMPVK